MNIINIKTPIEIAKAIKRQYYYNNQWSSTSKHSPEEIEKIYKNLEALPTNTKDKDLINTLVGFAHWRYNNCHNCNLDKLEKMVNVSTDYEGNKIILCNQCLTEAFNLINEK
jgi:hypothetical protein